MKHLVSLILLLSAGSAWAHPGHADGGFATGLIHPLLGLDHWLAMLGLGLWSSAARLRREALATVCVGLAAGAFMPLALPAVEPLLTASVLAAGLMGLGARRLPARAGLALAGAFSIMHGNAHGQEMAGIAATIGAITTSMALMALGWMAASNARVGKLAPALVALAGAGMLGFA